MIFPLPGGIEMSLVYPVGEVEDGRRKGVSVSRSGVEATSELLDLDPADLLPHWCDDDAPTLEDEAVQALGAGGWEQDWPAAP